MTIGQYKPDYYLPYHSPEFRAAKVTKAWTISKGRLGSTHSIFVHTELRPDSGVFLIGIDLLITPIDLSSLIGFTYEDAQDKVEGYIKASITLNELIS